MERLYGPQGGGVPQASEVLANNKKVGHPSPQLELRLLGDFAAVIGARQLPLSTRKAKALLGFLGLSDNEQNTRERLVGLFWSESDEDRARASLRQAIHEIRSACESVRFSGFQADRQTLALEAGSFARDVDEIFASVSKGIVHQRLLETQRIADTLLDGLDSVDPAFHVWISAKRQLLHDRLTLALESLLPAPGDPSDASPMALALLNLDPTHEVACRHLIRIRAARGDIGGAMKVYKTLWDLLETDYDIEPSKETQDLIVGIKQQVGQDPTPRAAPTPPVVPSNEPRAPGRRLFISICTFDGSGLPEGRRYVVNGFRHELVACLARFREWSVRALAPLQEPEPRTWSSPPEYVVEGSAYVSGGSIRLVITFRDASTSVCIWSERYTITLPGWFETQQRIVRQIATALNVHVSAERLRRVAAEPGGTLENHDLWLRGQALLHQVTPVDLEAASNLVKSLVRDAPDFSPAMSGMVQINNMEHIVYPGRFRDPAKQLKTLQIAQRAVQLDPLDSRAQLSLAWSFQMVGRVHESTLHAALATELNENDPWTLMSAGQIFAYCGDYARAEKLASASLDLTPTPTRSQMTYFSAIKFLCADYEMSAAAARKGFEASPAFTTWTCAALAQLGRTEEAGNELERAFAQITADWQGQIDPTPENMSRWMLHIFPIAVREDWERLRAGMAGAGAPVGDIVFGSW